MRMHRRKTTTAPRLRCQALEARVVPSVTVSVNAAANVHAIDPNVYGTAFASTAQLSDLNIPLNRDGGNASDTYSFAQDATNHGSDWYFESIASGTGNGQGMDQFVADSKAGGAQPSMTVNLFDWAAKLGSGGSNVGSYPISVYGAQQGTDPYNSSFGNGVTTGGSNITDTNPGYNYVANSPTAEQAWIQHLIGTFGDSQHGGVQYYSMGNEPALWNSTHRDIHPAGETNTELYNDIVNYAGMIKSLDPNAKIVGPEEWGWTGYFIDGADAAASNWGATYGGLNVQQWLLQQLQQHDASTGKRLLDDFTLHYYPQGDASGHQEFSNDVSTATQLLRNQSTRSLWDPNYVDQSWIASTGINGGKVNLINTMKSWVNAYYPGTKIGLTEYNWGAEGHMNGATTQADIWGILGREGLDLADRWTTPATGSPAYLAMKMYRNYDGNKSAFGDQSVSATVPNPDQVSAFAARRSADGALTVMVVNKNLVSSGASTSVTLNLSNFAGGGIAQEWQLAAVNPGDLTNASITRPGNVTVTNGSFTFTSPNQSVELFVIAPSRRLYATGVGAGGGPHVQVFDASTGALKFSFFAYGQTFTGGVRVAVADVNGDGVPDVITAPGPGGGPNLRVFDGTTGAQLAGPLGSFWAYNPAFTSGVFVAAADVTGDGKAEIITGAGAGGGPHVEVFDGATGQIIRSFFAYNSAFVGGVTVAAGDVTGDGKADIITGAGPGGGPNVKVFNGTNLATVYSFFAFDPSFSGGVFVAGGDLDGDGKTDMVAGQATGPSPRVRTFRGSDGNMTGDFTPFAGLASQNGVTVATEDRDGDGLVDVFVGTGPGPASKVRTFKGTTLGQIGEFSAYDPSFLGGVFVG
ncbi:MAG: glycoside hydrolase family 44 protein [Gemmataceae bacterium]